MVPQTLCIYREKCKRKFNPYLVPYTKINIKWFVDQESKIIQLLEENIGEIFYTGLDKTFLDTITKAQSINEKKTVKLQQN